LAHNNKPSVRASKRWQILGYLHLVGKVDGVKLKGKELTRVRNRGPETAIPAGLWTTAKKTKKR